MDNEGGPPVPVDLNETSDKGLTLVDDNDSGLILQLPPEGNVFHIIFIWLADTKKSIYVTCSLASPLASC